MTQALDQSALTVDLVWTAGDPVSISATVEGAAGWAGDYVIESTTAELAALTATVTADGDNAAVTITSDGPVTLTPGTYWWALQQVGGVTRMKGRAVVKS